MIGSFTLGGTDKISGTARYRFSQLVMAHSRLVVLLWAVLAVAGAATAGLTSARMTKTYTFPGQNGYKTNIAIGRHYHAGAQIPPVVVLLTLPRGTVADSPGVVVAADRAFRAARVVHPTRMVDYATTKDRVFLSGDGRSTYALVFTRAVTDAPDQAPSIEAAVQRAAPPGARVRTTGFEQLVKAGSSSHGVGVLAEVIIGAFGALLVLAYLFASFLALIPLLVAAVSVLTTFLLVLVMTTISDVSFIAQFLISLIGLGIAIDYSLLLVTRWREERAKGLDSEAAAHVAVATAGRAVVLSGVAVAIGLATLTLIPVPFLRSLGFSGILIPLVSVAVSVTLLPIVLARFGAKLDWPRRRTDASASRLWTGWAHGVVRARWVAALGAAAILAVLIVPFFGMVIGEPRTSALGVGGRARATLDELVRGGTPSGVVTPIEVLVHNGPSAASVRHQLATMPGVLTAVAPSDQSYRQAGTALIDVLPRDETGSSVGAATLDRVVKATRDNPDVIGVGGIGALDRDFRDAVYGRFPVILAALSLCTFLLLVWAFRSILLPLKAVVLNLASLAAAYGILTLVWQQGHGSNLFWGVPRTGAITTWVPIIIFAFLFGVSMDYEVFILTRIREEYDRLHDTRAAVIEGIGRTGRLVTGAALILFCAFLSLTTAPVTDIKMVGTAMGAGILLDATVVRALLVPALITLLGRCAWWMPRRRRTTSGPRGGSTRSAGQPDLSSIQLGDGGRGVQQVM